MNDEYLSLCEINYKHRKKLEQMTPVSITTMTMIYDLNILVDIQALSTNYIMPEYPKCFIKNNTGARSKRSFYNQITISFRDHTTKSVKVFSNGRLQITGLTSMNECKSTTKIIFDILKKSDNVLKSDATYIFSRECVYIAMINTSFSYGMSLNILYLKISAKKFYY